MLRLLFLSETKMKNYLLLKKFCISVEVSENFRSLKNIQILNNISSLDFLIKVNITVLFCPYIGFS